MKQGVCRDFAAGKLDDSLFRGSRSARGAPTVMRPLTSHEPEIEPKEPTLPPRPVVKSHRAPLVVAAFLVLSFVVAVQPGAPASGEAARGPDSAREQVLVKFTPDTHRPGGRRPSWRSRGRQRRTWCRGRRARAAGSGRGRRRRRAGVGAEWQGRVRGARRGLGAAGAAAERSLLPELGCLEHRWRRLGLVPDPYHAGVGHHAGRPVGRRRRPRHRLPDGGPLRLRRPGACPAGTWSRGRATHPPRPARTARTWPAWSGSRSATAPATQATAPRCKIMPVQIGSDSGASLSDMATGITWAADHGARVINLSWAGTASSSTLASAVSYARSKGVVVVAAAGNSNCDCKTYPAGTAGVIGVAGTTSTGSKQGDSNYGSWVTVAAPEGNLTAWPTVNGQPGYAAFGGTSSAAPVVAGIAGLLFSYDTSLSGSQVEQALESTAVAVPFAVQYGRVDALAALQSLGASDPQPTSAPVQTAAPKVYYQLNGLTSIAPLTTAPQPGQVLVRGIGGWSGSAGLSVSGLQWQRCDTSGGSCTYLTNLATYTVQPADAGYSIKLSFSVKNAVGSTPGLGAHRRGRRSRPAATAAGDHAREHGAPGDLRHLAGRARRSPRRPATGRAARPATPTSGGAATPQAPAVSPSRGRPRRATPFRPRMSAPPCARPSPARTAPGRRPPCRRRPRSSLGSRRRRRQSHPSTRRCP